MNINKQNINFHVQKNNVHGNCTVFFSESYNYSSSKKALIKTYS